MSFAHSMSSRSGSGLSSRLSNGVFGSSSMHGAYGGTSHSVSKLASYGLSSGSGGGLTFGGAGTSGFGMNFASSGGDGLASANEKYTMQNLNDRLSNYMEKVRSLEEANSKLEEKIHEWYEHQGSVTVREQNYSPYYATIEELREKICKATTENNQILLAVDNARLAADDFKQKYETELHLRMAVEADIQGLRKVLDELTLCKSDSEMQIENLTEELTYMKKNHEEEMNEKGQQIRGTVNVEMDAAPGTDLSKILADMREQYEYITERNRREAEAWYQAQCDSLHKEVATHTEQVQTSKTEITDLRRTFQGLEIELQSQHTMRAGLEASVSETEARYAAQLNHIQSIIGSLEDQLGDLRSELDHQNQEYKSLLNIKAHLDAEITTYHKLLDEHDHSIGGNQKESSGSTKTTTTTTTTTVKQEAPSTDKK